LSSAIEDLKCVDSKLNNEMQTCSVFSNSHKERGAWNFGMGLD